MAISAMSQRAMLTGFDVAFAAGLGEVSSGGDAELERQSLEQDGEQVRQHDDEEQGVAVARAGLQIGGPVAGVHVADGDEKAGPEKAESAAPEVRRLRDADGGEYLRHRGPAGGLFELWSSGRHADREN